MDEIHGHEYGLKNDDQHSFYIIARIAKHSHIIHKHLGCFLAQSSCSCSQDSACRVSVWCEAFAASAREPQLAFLPRKVILRHSCTSSVQPIGGDGDGVMERKDVMRWTPLLEQFLNENAQLVATDTTSTNPLLKTTFDVNMLQRKWQSFKETYQRIKREHKVSRHPLAGETGAYCQRARMSCGHLFVTRIVKPIPKTNFVSVSVEPRVPSARMCS
jgi:hypothetical protein